MANGVRVMGELQQPQKRDTAKLLPWLKLSDPIEFELLAHSCYAMNGNPAEPIGAFLTDLSALPATLIARFLRTPDTAALAVLCRSIGLSRSSFEALTLSCAPTLGSASLTPACALFDALSCQRAERIVAYWRICEPSDNEPVRFAVPRQHREI